MARRPEVREIHPVANGDITDPALHLQWLAAFQNDTFQCSRFCQTYIEYMEADPGRRFDHIRLSLSHSIITTYARPFRLSDASDRSERWRLARTFLSEGDYAFADSLLERTHERLLELRDTAVAHSDENVRGPSFTPGAPTTDEHVRTVREEFEQLGAPEYNALPHPAMQPDTVTCVEHQLHPEMLPLVGAMTQFIGRAIAREMSIVRELLPGVSPKSNRDAANISYPYVTTVTDEDRAHPWLVLPPPSAHGVEAVVVEMEDEHSASHHRASDPAR